MNDTRNDYIQTLMGRLDSQRKELENLLERVKVLEKSIAFNKLRLDEARLVKDIRDGKLIVMHAETGNPVKVAFFNAA